MHHKIRHYVLIAFVVILLLCALIGVFMFATSPKTYRYTIDVGASPKYDIVYDFNKNYLTDKEGKVLLPFTSVGGSPSADWARGQQATALSEVNPWPQGIHVRFFSVAENQFYEGEYQFDQRIFQRLANYTVHHVIFRKKKPFSDYMGITLYTVPGGLVTVWIDGQGDKYLLAQFTAKKIEEPNWRAFSRVLQRREEISREDYVQESLNAHYPMLAETRRELAAGHIPDATPWLRLMKKYPWRLTVNDEFQLQDYVTSYINGEQYYTYQEEHANAQINPVPYRISLYVLNHTQDDKKERLEIFLDKEEIMQAFETLEAQQRPPNSTYDLHLNINPDLKEFFVYLMSADGSIELKNSKGLLKDLYIGRGQEGYTEK